MISVLEIVAISGQTADLVMPGAFVLDRSGIVVLAHVDPNYTTRLESAAILKAVRSMR